MKFTETLIKKITLLLLLVALVSCSDNSSSPNDNNNNGTSGSALPAKRALEEAENVTFDADFTDNTVYFDKNSLSDLIDYDSDNFVYTFNASSEKAQSLKDGDILFIYGIALRKVTKVTEDNGKIVVETDHANLNDLIKNGKIGWEQPIDFNTQLKPTLLVKGQKPHPLDQNGNNFEGEFELGDYKGKITIQMNNDSANVSCELSKSKGGAKATCKFEGKVFKFISKSIMEYKDSKLQNFDYQNDNSSGELKLTLIATASGTDQYNNMEFPVLLFEAPFVVAGIPVMVKIKVVFVLNIVLPTLDASCWVSALFKFNSSTGIKFDGVQPGISGHAGPYTIEKDKTQTGGSVAVSGNFGIGFPQVELSLFNDVIVPYARTAFLIGGFYQFGTNAYQTAEAEFIGAVGFNFEFLGLKASGSKTLWEYKKTLLDTRG